MTSLALVALLALAPCACFALALAFARAVFYQSVLDELDVARAARQRVRRAIAGAERAEGALERPSPDGVAPARPAAADCARASA